MKKTIQLNVSLDLGASSSKGMYSLHSKNNPEVNTVNSIAMEPEIVEVPISLLKERLKCDAKPENVAWISYRAKDEEAVMVGTLAKKYVLKGNCIENVKYESATDKCLALIGAIAVKHELLEIPESKLEICLNLLIPSDEKHSKKILEKNLRNSLKRFYFQERAISCKLMAFSLFVEGTGGLLHFIGQNQSYDEKTIVVLMLGHRNCSCLILKKGDFIHDSVRLGYFDYVQSIKERSIGQKIEDLEYAMPQIDRDPDNSEFWINSLIRGNISANQEEERNRLISAIEVAKKLHWKKVSNWLDAKIPRRLDKMLVLGGASLSFKEELSKEFSWIEKINWGEDIVAELEKFGVEKSMVDRFADVFSLHKQHFTLEIEN